MRHRGHGFTLVEVLIVMAIITVLAAVAIPGFLRARSTTNESAAVEVLHTLVVALENYQAAQTPPAYPPTLATLGGGALPYVDATLASDPAQRQGYTFAYQQVSTSQYVLTAAPVTPGVTGNRTFETNESGVITVDGVPLQ